MPIPAIITALIAGAPSVLNFFGLHNQTDMVQKNANRTYKETEMQRQEQYTRRREVAHAYLQANGYFDDPAHVQEFEQLYPTKMVPGVEPGLATGPPGAGGQLAAGVIGAIGSAYHDKDKEGGGGFSGMGSNPIPGLGGGGSPQSMFPEIDFGASSSSAAPPITGPGFASKQAPAPSPTPGVPTSAAPGPPSAGGAPLPTPVASASSSTPNYDTFNNMVYDPATGTYKPSTTTPQVR